MKENMVSSIKHLKENIEREGHQRIKNYRKDLLANYNT
jgi:hypothetical protein